MFPSDRSQRAKAPDCRVPQKAEPRGRLKVRGSESEQHKGFLDQQQEVTRCLNDR